MNYNVAFIQSPRERLDYTFDFTDWLQGQSSLDADSVYVSDFVDVTIAPENELNIDAVTIEQKTVKVFLSGGLVDKTYKVRCLITTTTNVLKESVITVTIKDY